MQANGVKIDNKSGGFIQWLQFLRMNTLLNFHCATNEQYIDFWTRFMNPLGRSYVTREDFEERIELLARGRYTDVATLISK